MTHRAFAHKERHLQPLPDEDAELERTVEPHPQAAPPGARNGIDTIESTDTALDAVRGLRRVDPLDERAVERLLAAA